MHFEETDRVSHPAALILETMIERMQEIVPFLDNIESIELQEREDLPGGRLRIVRRWQGAATSVPSVLRPFVTPELLAWLDTAIWVPDEYRVEWSHSSCVRGAAQLYDCSGINYFEPDGSNATRIRITGELIIHPDRVPGVPRFLASRIAPQIESFVIGLITPNLTGLARGLQRYFAAREGGKRGARRKS
jgi:hypothetical protein